MHLHFYHMRILYFGIPRIKHDKTFLKGKNVFNGIYHLTFSTPETSLILFPETSLHHIHNIPHIFQGVEATIIYFSLFNKCRC